MKKLLSFVLVLLGFLAITGCDTFTPEYTVTFNVNGGEVIEEVIITEGKAISEPDAPIFDGYNFLGWYSDSTLNVSYDFAGAVLGDITLHAKWELAEFELAYNSNGGTLIPLESVLFGDSLTIPNDPTKNDAVFGGWFTDEELTDLFAFDTMPSNDVMLYAKWIPIYAIIFNENGGQQVENITFLHGDSVPELTPSHRLGYTFNGWYSDEELTTLYTETTLPDNNLELYAGWSINEYTIKFYDINENLIQTSTIDYKSDIDYPDPIIVDDYTFVNWLLNDNVFEDETMPAMDIDLYANYKSDLAVLRWNIDDDPYSLDPGIVGSRSAGDVINNTFEGLVRETDSIVRPGIAESWEFSEDGLTLTFHLRESNWSDGTPLTAYDFEYSWLRAMSPVTQSEYSWIWEYTNIVGAVDYTQGEAPASSVGIEVIDSYTLEVTFTKPTFYFPSLTSLWHFMPVKESVVSVMGWDKNPAQNVSNGAFKIIEYSLGETITLEKNDQYWQSSTVEIDRIELYFNSSFTAYSKYLSGEMDVLSTVPTSEVAQLKITSDDYYYFPYLGTYYYAFNLDKDNDGVNEDFTEDGIFANLNLRKALAYAVNRNEITEAIVHGIPATGFLGPNFLDDEGADIHYTIEGEKLPTDDSGYTKAQEFFTFAATEMNMTLSELRANLEQETLYFNVSEGHMIVADCMVNTWEDVLGFTINTSSVEWPMFTQNRTDGNYNIARGGWLTDFIDPSGMFAIFESNNYYNFHNFFNVEFDLLMENANTATTPAQHFAYIYQAYEIIMEEMPIIPLYHYSDDILVSSNVTGWERSNLAVWDFTRSTIE